MNCFMQIPLPQSNDTSSGNRFTTVLRAGKGLLEYLGGSREELPPAVPAWFASPWALGIWWSLLATLILFFSGQTSKFIYIDF